MKPLYGISLALGVAACQTVPTAGQADSASSAVQPQASAIASGGNDKIASARAFVEAACAGCHAIDRQGLSPNPDAPPFAAIVNQEGLTAETLSNWLMNAHNYPEEMDFYLDSSEVDALTVYMLTLRDPSYRPAI